MTDQRDDLNQQARQQWDQKAEFWDQLHGDDGNRFHRELVSPAVEKLLAVRPGCAAFWESDRQAGAYGSYEI